MTPEFTLQQVIQKGSSIMIGSANRELRPACARASGARATGEQLIVFVDLHHSQQVIENVKSNPKVSVTLSDPLDHTSYQVKGKLVTIRSSLSDEDLEAQKDWFKRFRSAAIAVGVEPSTLDAYIVGKSVAFEIEVLERYLQNPGPLAGKRIP